MATAFRADGGVVVEITTYPDDVELSDCFHPDLGFRPVQKGASPKVGMTWDGKAFGPAPPSSPIVPRPRTATVSALLDALSASQRGTITADHMSRLVARAQLGPVVLGDPKVKRAADDMSITPDAWFTLAGA